MAAGVASSIRGTTRVGHDVVVEPLADHACRLETIAGWLKAEWPTYYGPHGPGDARKDLSTFAQRDRLPVGVIAFAQGIPCGVAALKAESIASHRHLTPWAAAGCVVPELRRRGIGSALLAALESQARALGFREIFCASATADSLLRRRDWLLLERVAHEDGELRVYRKTLGAQESDPKSARTTTLPDRNANSVGLRKPPAGR